MNRLTKLTATAVLSAALGACGGAGDPFEGVYSFTVGEECVPIDFDKELRNVLLISTVMKADNKHYVMDITDAKFENPQSRPALKSGDGGVTFVFGDGLKQSQMRVQQHPEKKDHLLLTEWRMTAVNLDDGNLLKLALDLINVMYKKVKDDASPMPNLAAKELCLKKEPPQR